MPEINLTSHLEHYPSLYTVMVHSLPTRQVVFSSRPVVRTIRTMYFIPLVRTSGQVGEYSEFACDLHLHGGKNVQKRFF